MTNSAQPCPQCHASIPADAPGGICPACALKGAMEGTGGVASVAPTMEMPSRAAVAGAFPEYEVMEVIGQGGMGVVFKARQMRLDRRVALKVLPPALAAQSGFAERFTREARALARLVHPNIVAAHDFGERAGFYYLVMEYVEGVNLREALRAGVTPEQALQLVPKICEALQFAHDRGVLHRDVKPENILLDRTGTPKLADFGIAKLAGEAGGVTGLTGSGAALGTAAYMAPEQIEQPATVDHRADIYSLGVVLYEMLTGELPLGRFAAPSEKSEVSGRVDEVVLRALEKERSRRQQSATEMKTEVEGVNSELPSATQVSDEWERRDAQVNQWVKVFNSLTAMSAVGIVVFPMLGLRFPSAAQAVAFVLIFGTLASVAEGFKPRPPVKIPKEKDLGMAYVFWFLLGLVGGHRFYLGQIGWGLLYLFTGGLFFIGWIVDLFMLPRMVRETNEEIQRRRAGMGVSVPPARVGTTWTPSAGLIALLFLLLLAGVLSWAVLRVPKDKRQFSFKFDGDGGSIHFHLEPGPKLVGDIVPKPWPSASPAPSPKPARLSELVEKERPVATPTPQPK